MSTVQISNLSSEELSGNALLKEQKHVPWPVICIQLAFRD